MLRTLVSIPLLVMVLGGLLVSGCGESEAETSRTLRIYSSQPMRGDRGGEDMVRAVEIAVENAGGEIDGAKLEVIGLNDAREDGQYDPKLVRENAREAAEDDRTVAYVGDYDSGATEIAMPILNRAGILQVSAGSTKVALTRPDPRTGERIRPTGIRTFGRIVPNDRIQAAALTLFMNEESVERVFVVDDRSSYGAGLRQMFIRSAGPAGIEVVGARSASVPDETSKVADEVINSTAQAVLFTGADLGVGLDLFHAVHRSDHLVKLFGGDGLAVPGFLDMLGDLELDTYVTAPVLPLGNYARSGEAFFRAYHRRHGEEADPMAVFGYEAGRVVVDSIRAGVHGDIRTEAISTLRKGIRDAFFKMSERASPLGSYSIDAWGDTTLSFYGAYRVEDGELVLGRSIDIPPSAIGAVDG